MLPPSCLRSGRREPLLLRQVRQPAYARARVHTRNMRRRKRATRRTRDAQPELDARSVMMTSGYATPAARVQSNAAGPIGPAPQITTASPRCRFACSTAASLTESGSGSAPSLKERSEEACDTTRPDVRYSGAAGRPGVRGILVRN